MTAPITTAADAPDLDAAVQLRGVAKRYSRRSTPALAGVSMAFPSGSLTAVMGLSGSGKTTLLQSNRRDARPTQPTIDPQQSKTPLLDGSILLPAVPTATQAPPPGCRWQPVNSAPCAPAQTRRG